MRKFWIGFAAALIAVLTVAFCYVRFGFIDPRADIPINSLESRIAMPSLDAAIGRLAHDQSNPVLATDANLNAGMKLYQANCSICHGDIKHPHGRLADALYPRAPQFLEDAPDMPENQNYYIIQHGIRLSGMPAWKQAFSSQQIWQVTTFLSHIGKLTGSVSEQWEAEADSSSYAEFTHRPTPTDGTMHMK